MSDAEINENVQEKLVIKSCGSMDDLSEYTDADESISAPTELLAEFLSAVMMKDYENALKYCRMILTYEPNNSTAKEFYPLIVKKLETSDSDDSSSYTSDTSDTSSNSSSPISYAGTNGKGHSDRTTASYSSLEEDGNINSEDELCRLSEDIQNGNLGTFTECELTSESNKTSASGLEKDEDCESALTEKHSPSNEQNLTNKRVNTDAYRNNAPFLDRKKTYTTIKNVQNHSRNHSLVKPVKSTTTSPHQNLQPKMKTKEGSSYSLGTKKSTKLKGKECYRQPSSSFG